MPVQSMAELWVNGERVTVGSTAEGDLGFPVSQYAKGGKNHLWVRFYNGNQTAADPLLVNRVGGSNGRPYQAIQRARRSGNRTFRRPSRHFGWISGSKSRDPFCTCGIRRN